MGRQGTGVGRRSVLAGAGVGGLIAISGGPAAAKPGGSGGASRVTTPADAIVETQHGKVRGCVRDGIYVFKGVPYGKETSAAARFLPPEAPAAWTNVRSAIAYGPCCPQVVRSGWQSAETAFIYDWDDGFPGEDCLRLNVWSPGPGKGSRPVMFWIHGGGYEAGSSQELPSYDGERLARRGDVVVISVNHRLGPFGFLDLSEAGGERYAQSANAGMLDLVLALQWVRANAAAFGGDPGNVTVFGQSGGGAKVSHLMAMPSAKGLFHKAIVQSGSLLDAGDPARSRRIAAEVLKALGIAPTELDKLASVAAVDLVNAGETARKAMPKAPSGKLDMLWQPTGDGSVLPAQPWAAAPAQSKDVPMIIGATLNEYSPSLGNPALEDMGEAQAKGMAAAIAGAGPAAWAAYRTALPKAKPVEVLSQLVSARFSAPSVLQAQRKAAQGGKAWLYRFDYNPASVLDGRVRAFHCAELAYCFDNVDRCLNATGGTAEARALASKVADAWIAFARTGDPNHNGLPAWAPVSAEQTPHMLFDTTCRVVADPGAKLRAALAG
jgi:para-nitrobenzyl esterase